MKVNVVFSVDFKVLKKFISFVENEGLSLDEAAEKAMRRYCGKNSKKHNTDVVDGVVGADVDAAYVKFTEDLLKKCKEYKVGALANKLLRGLLEKGIASKEEIEKMQEVPATKLAARENMKWGDYCKKSFGLNFPLLLKDGVSDFIKSKCRKNPVEIYGVEYYICAQWFERPENNDRIPLENWIRRKLPEWFSKADEEEKKEMRKFLSEEIF